jgi:hypothetical protein
VNDQIDQTSVACPECGASIDVNALLYHTVEEDLRKKITGELADERKVLQAKLARLEADKASLEQSRQAIGRQIEDGVKARLSAERQVLAAQIRKAVTDESAGQFTELQAELARKSEQVKELHRTKSEIERLKREKDELKESIEAAAEARLNETLREEKGRIQKAADDRVQLKLSEKDSVIEQLRDQLQEAHRKAEQGSMQLQGEVQEVAIEEWLRKSFPLDSISEVKKGARGADCVHVVHTRTQQNCGVIYYESKRAKDFQPNWIEKFKQDLRARGANLGVIVTEVMPRGMERMGMKDGVWICTFEEFKGLCVALRQSLVQVASVQAAQDNKGDKMAMLYDYLTSNEFRLQIEAIVEGFAQMQADLASERRAMESSWKRREKQIEKVLLSTNHMYSSIKGIAGSAVQSVPALEFQAVEVA